MERSGKPPSTSVIPMMSQATALPAKRPGDLPPTDTLVVGAAIESEGLPQRAAREQLYRLYYPHVLRGLAQKGIDERRAEEATQDFFARLFDPDDHLGRSFLGVRVGQGSFGGWLKLVSWRALLNRLRTERTKQNGGGMRPLSIESEEATTLEAVTPVAESLDDECAKVLIVRRAYERLRNEYSTLHEVGFVDDLYDYLAGDGHSLTREYFKAAFATTDDALRQRRSRMKATLARYLVAEANELFAGSDHIEGELRRLALLE